MSELCPERTAMALWQELVSEAEQRAHLTLDEELESYLVLTLLYRQNDAELNARALALDLLEGMRAHRGHRHQGLRDVGDRCLLLAGLYPEQVQRRNVSASYFLDLGAAAYTSLAQSTRSGLADLFMALAQSISQLVRVLLEVRRNYSALQPLLDHDMARATGSLHSTHFSGAVLLDGPERAQ